MLAWYRHLRMTPKIVLPVTIVLVVILSFLTWQIQSKSSQAIESVAKENCPLWPRRTATSSAAS